LSLHSPVKVKKGHTHTTFAPGHEHVDPTHTYTEEMLPKE